MGILYFLEQPLFYEYLFLLTTISLTLISQSHLLYKCLHVSSQESLSANILINMALWCLASLAGIIYMGYMIFSSMTEKSGPFIFASGSIFVSLTTAVSLSVLFLLLDRIFILTMPMHYRRNRQTFLAVNIVSCVFLFFYLVIGLVLTELPVEEKTTCNSFGCVLKRNNGVIFTSVKISLGLVNMIVAIIFQAVLHNYSETTAAKKRHFKRANILTTIAVCTEFLCNFLPNLLWSIAAHLQWQHLASSGPYAALMIGVDALLTAFIYRFIITSKRGFRLGTRHFAWAQQSNSKQHSGVPHPTIPVSNSAMFTTMNHHTESTFTLQIPVWSIEESRMPGILTNK